MEIGIISDIHAGLTGLTSALVHLDRTQVDQIVCAGDLVDFGDSGDAVVQHITEMRIPCVQGNHDRMAKHNQGLRQRKHEQGQPLKPLLPKTIAHLNRLPQTIRFEWENTTVLLTHATPWGDDTYVYPSSTTPLLRRIVREADADIVILGHTHEPMWVELDNCAIINPGSTSQNYALGFGTFGVLSLPDRLFRLHEVETGKQTPLSKQHR